MTILSTENRRNILESINQVVLDQLAKENDCPKCGEVLPNFKHVREIPSIEFTNYLPDRKDKLLEQGLLVNIGFNCKKGHNVTGVIYVSNELIEKFL